MTAKSMSKEEFFRYFNSEFREMYEERKAEAIAELEERGADACF